MPQALAGAGLLLGALASGAEPAAVDIAFGSCLYQNRPQPIWDQVLAVRPALFIFTGDSLYADADDPETLRARHRQFRANPQVQAIMNSTQVLATWDDHDYGSQDGGAEYPLKALSRELFVDSFRVPPESRARQGPGIYDARMLQLGPWRVQVILLDTRSFRDPLRQRRPGDDCASGHYSANPDPEARLLGDAQWHWLAEQLLQPADLRLIVSGIQVIPDQHCWEKWGNFPHERARLFALIRRQRAEGVILISGDRHFADITRLPAAELGYPLYEVTASGLNSGSRRPPEPNRYRAVKTSYSGDHFGLLRISRPRRCAPAEPADPNPRGPTPAAARHPLAGPALRRRGRTLKRTRERLRNSSVPRPSARCRGRCRPGCGCPRCADWHTHSGRNP